MHLIPSEKLHWVQSLNFADVVFTIIWTFWKTYQTEKIRNYQTFSKLGYLSTIVTAIWKDPIFNKNQIRRTLIVQRLSINLHPLKLHWFVSLWIVPMTDSFLLLILIPCPHVFEQRSHSDQLVQFGHDSILQNVIRLVSPKQSKGRALQTLVCFLSPWPHVAEHDVSSFQGVNSQDLKGHGRSSCVDSSGESLRQ